MGRLFCPDTDTTNRGTPESGKERQQRGSFHLRRKKGVQNVDHLTLPCRSHNTNHKLFMLVFPLEPEPPLKSLPLLPRSFRCQTAIEDLEIQPTVVRAFKHPRFILLQLILAQPRRLNIHSAEETLPFQLRNGGTEFVIAQQHQFLGFLCLARLLLPPEDLLTRKLPAAISIKVLVFSSISASNWEINISARVDNPRSELRQEERSW